MKVSIGSKLYKVREDRKLNQAEMADLLMVSQATYSRMERNESSIELDDLMSISKKLDIPLWELLPDTLTVYNTSSGQGGSVNFGNITNYYSNPEAEKKITSLEEEIKQLKKELGKE